MARQPHVPEALRGLRKKAIRQGWVITRARRAGHWQWKSPDGRSIVTVPYTPGNGARSVENTIGHLRRAGLRI